MNCRSKTELTLCQLSFLIILCMLTTLLAIFGWFRHVDPVEYKSTTAHYNNVTSIIRTHSHSLPYLDDIGTAPLLKHRHSYVQWTILQMNDVYELKPLSGGKKGGLARVATIRKLLLQENPHTLTIIAGDIVSPSALGNSIVNGTALNGKQMIAALNTLGVDYATLGNHEFDLKEVALRHRINESKFQWIASNVYELNTTTTFRHVLPYKILTIANIKILLIGLTIDDNLGPNPSAPYVTITSQRTLPQFTHDYIKSLRNEFHLTWDVLICLTHLNMQNDIEIVEHNPDIEVVLGGHEHENYFLKRGSKYTPIYKADDNAFTVFIHRFAYQPQTKQLLIFSKLTRVSDQFPDEPETARVANYYYDAGLQAYREQGYDPDRTICVLPLGLNFDGRSSIIRAQQTHLTDALCHAMTSATNTTICVFNSGAIRLDDQISGTITEYDILRCLPFATHLVTIDITGSSLVKILTRGLANINTGMFPSYTGLEYDSVEEKWFLNSTKQLLDDENLRLTFVSIPYFYHNTDLKLYGTLVDTPVSMTKAFINYLTHAYGNSTTSE